MALLRTLLSLLWIAAVAAYAWTTWPQMSLDLGNDPATRAAYDQAVMMHVGYFALIALAPPLLAWLIARMMASKS